MNPARYLADTSALARLLRHDNAYDTWEREIDAGTVAICPIVELELLYTARSKAERERLMGLLETAFAWVVMPDGVFDRAAEVQALLTARGAHRSAGPVDLLTGATAELHGMALVHYDRDFDQIAKLTGQPTQWLAEPGSVN
jgi:predicted nucleic acid-binding protein